MKTLKSFGSYVISLRQNVWDVWSRGATLRCDGNKWYLKCLWKWYVNCVNNAVESLKRLTKRVKSKFYHRFVSRCVYFPLFFEATSISKYRWIYETRKFYFVARLKKPMGFFVCITCSSVSLIFKHASYSIPTLIPVFWNGNSECRNNTQWNLAAEVAFMLIGDVLFLLSLSILVSHKNCASIYETLLVSNHFCLRSFSVHFPLPS